MISAGLARASEIAVVAPRLPLLAPVMITEHMDVSGMPLLCIKVENNGERGNRRKTHSSSPQPVSNTA